MLEVIVENNREIVEKYIEYWTSRSENNYIKSYNLRQELIQMIYEKFKDKIDEIINDSEDLYIEEEGEEIVISGYDNYEDLIDDMIGYTYHQEIIFDLLTELSK